MKILALAPLLLVSQLTAGPESATAVTAARTEATVIIGGQVRRPGPVPFRKDLSLYAAVQSAGGATEFGSMRRVKVIRDKKVTVHDLTDDKQKLVKLRADDVIEIPQKTLFGR